MANDTKTTNRLRLAPEITLSPTATGEWFAKHRVTRRYFRLGAEEHLLLTSVDGGLSDAEIRRAYEKQFDDELTAEELAEFIKSSKSQGLLVDATSTETARPPGLWAWIRGRAIGRSVFYFRIPLWDPDRFLTAAAPRLAWMWTRGAVVVYLLLAMLAGSVWIGELDTLSAQLANAFGVHSVLVMWVAIVGATMLHELAHGLTCKRYGGHVPEIGLLFMFFTPCMYCNVSDAYLLPKRWHRVLVTLAGPICDLLIWSLATLVWRVTVPGNAVNHLALLVGSVCGARTLLNVNPFSRVDGYYILADLVDQPNLRKNGMACWLEVVRWVLWGAERPRGLSWNLLAYGFLTWSLRFVIFVVLIGTGLRQMFQATGFWGSMVVLYLGWLTGGYVMRGTIQGEFKKMLQTRPSRRTIWAAAIAGVLGVLVLVPLRDRSSGQFAVRPSERVETRTVIEGFVGEVFVQEGMQVEQGQIVARLHVPDLDSRLRTKVAELHEAEATLRRLEAGPRPEVVATQRDRVARATNWLRMAEIDLQKSTIAFEQELARLDKQIEQSEIELTYARQTLDYAVTLYNRSAYAGQQLRSDQRRVELAQLSLEQSRAQRRTRESTGLMDARNEVERRRKELADAKAELALLEAGTRPEELDAERARQQRLREELRHLQELAQHRELRAPAAGTVTTAHLRERTGAYLQRGELFCEIQCLDEVEAEISINEQEIVGVSVGQTVELTARALPLDRFHGLVTRIGSKAVGSAGAGAGAEHARGTLAVYCRVAEKDARLLSGMTGFARIYREHRSLGGLLWQRIARSLRTEMWW